MNSCLLASSLQPFPHTTTKSFNLLLTLRRTKQRHFLFISSKFNSPKFISSSSSSNGSNIPSNQAIIQNDIFHSEVTNPQLNSSNPKLSFGDQAFFLLAFIACTTSAAFAGLVFAAVPTLFAMRNAAISFSKLADTAREELPSTMTAVRLSGMEISDLTLELSDLSQEITDGISKSAQALQAAETGIRQIGSVAQQHTISMIEERANLPEISLQPVVAGAARKTSRAVGRATKSLMNMISGRQSTTENDDDITYI
ncbi:hypothetical protein L195_g014358 [Trifolium pratense]|uniref:Uncharacterized protein n=3 Tax=Trifolium TaxID=3898 RepID=A0ACB0JBB0_TRIPR|nr:uncharacterized protein LOC123918325 [Trifolium pratense]PNY17610.1 hypothetical protein L195_g014358 [Trifolium pratense]CAJ2642314.1 unnamed protein product [Trifolium pratense]